MGNLHIMDRGILMSLLETCGNPTSKKSGVRGSLHFVMLHQTMDSPCLPCYFTFLLCRGSLFEVQEKFPSFHKLACAVVIELPTRRRSDVWWQMNLSGRTKSKGMQNCD